MPRRFVVDADRATGVSTSVDVGTQQTVTITDDDAAPVLSLDVSSATIAEAGGHLDGDRGHGHRLHLRHATRPSALALGGTATVIDDYSIGATTLTLPAGVGTAAAQITTTVTAVDDDFFEGTTNEAAHRHRLARRHGLRRRAHRHHHRERDWPRSSR